MIKTSTTKNKATLALIEQIIMVLVFALAAAVCLNCFVWADSASAQLTARDQAVLAVENAAEAIQNQRGDFAAAALLLPKADGGKDHLLQRFDADWQPLADNDTAEEAYVLQAQRTGSADAYLGRAWVVVSRAGGEEIFAVEIAWQEEVPNAE